MHRRSSPHTDGSVGFTRWRQCASITPQRTHTLYQCYPPLSRFKYIDCQTRPGTYWAGHFCPSQLPLPMWGSEPPSNTWFLAATGVHNPNGISISSAVFGQITTVSDRQRDHTTLSVTIGRMYARRTAMWPSNRWQWQMWSTVVYTGGTHSPSQLAWSEGRQTPGAEFAFMI